MSDVDSGYSVAKIDEEKWKAFQDWQQNRFTLLDAVAEEAAVVAELCIDTQTGGTEEDPVFALRDAGTQLRGLYLAAEGGIGSAPTDGVTRWGNSHNKRKSKRVESRQ